jgi:RimJ/RimL family protein N-acetyltransferase
MGLAEFRAYHEPALMRDEVTHGLLLGALAQASGEQSSDLSIWTLGGPGQCAMRLAGHSIVLGDLGEAQCRELAELTADSDYPGVFGPGMSGVWFSERAVELGVQFLEPDRMRLHVLRDKPRFPGSAGYARPVTIVDLALFTEWFCAFQREAVPHDPPPARAGLERRVTEGGFLFWIDEEPVSMAGIVRRLKNSAAIGGVYTPPGRRGRGYAGAVTAATVERIYGEGYPLASLYTDTSNPAADRCYRKIGFAPIGEALHFHKVRSTAST